MLIRLHNGLQPQYPARPRLSSSFLASARFLTLGSQPNYAPLPLAVTSYTTAERDRIDGVASVRWVNASFDFPGADAATEWTIAAVVRRREDNYYGPKIFGTGDTYADNQRLDTNHGFGASHTFQGFLYDGTSPRYMSSTAYLRADEWSRVVLTCTESEMLLAANGAADASVAVNNAGRAVTNKGWLGPNTQTDCAEGLIALCLRTNRAWTKRERDHFIRDPYNSVFAPRKLVFPVNAGATLPTLSAATYVPGSITSSGFRPRVTAS